MTVSKSNLFGKANQKYLVKNLQSLFTKKLMIDGY